MIGKPDDLRRVDCILSLGNDSGSGRLPSPDSLSGRGLLPRRDSDRTGIDFARPISTSSSTSLGSSSIYGRRDGVIEGVHDSKDFFGVGFLIGISGRGRAEHPGGANLGISSPERGRPGGLGGSASHDRTSRRPSSLSVSACRSQISSDLIDSWPFVSWSRVERPDVTPRGLPWIKRGNSPSSVKAGARFSWQRLAQER